MLGCSCALAATEQARPSDSLVDSIGVNIHALRTNGPYGNIASMAAAINDMGIRYVDLDEERKDTLRKYINMVRKP